MAISAQEQAMRRLGFTDEEIASIREYDAKVEAGEDPAPLTPEQEKASKEARAIGQKTKGNYQFTQRERKADEDKREIVEALRTLAESIGDNVAVINPERELTFARNGRKYKIVLSAPRS